MALPRSKAASLLRATVILLCKLLLADVMCSLVCDWLLYLIMGIRNLTSKSSEKSPYFAIKDSSGIQVILCGISRSGTTSLWHAMDILGFPCLHGIHLMKPTNCKLFTKAMSSGSYKDWEHLLHDYRAISDFPATSAYKQLMEVYPNAKVILNVRNPKKWYRSFSETLLDVSNGFEFQIIKPHILRCYNKFFYQQILKGTPEDEELSIQNYNLHVEEVKRYVPPHKLHVFELEKNEGWKELCDFLEVPIPNVPFPFLNDRETFQKQRGRKINLVLRTIIVSYLTFALFVIVHCFQWILS